jgi:Putative peptidoglycan binding domain/CHAP domain
MEAIAEFALSSTRKRSASMFQTQLLGGKSTRSHMLLLLSAFLVAAVLFSFTAGGQAHAASTAVSGNNTATPAVNGNNIAAIAKGQIGGHCTKYYGCPYPGEWCAEFGIWVWSHAGANISGLTAGSGSFYVYGQKHHTLSNTPKVGDAIVYGYNGAGYAEHVAIVVSVNTSNHTIRSVGGNEGGGAGVVQEDGPYRWTVGGSPTGQTISGYIAPAGGGSPPPPTCPATIENGSTGTLVATLQSELQSLYSKKAFGNTPYNFHPPLAVDGIFGPNTENAVKDFQTKKGLSVDGIVGPHTWHTLGHC